MKMNRSIACSALMAVLALLAGACGKEMEHEPVDSGEKVVITATFPESTKVAFTEGDEALDLSWQQDDYLTIICGETVERFDMISFNGKTALFSGNPVEGESFDIVLSRSGNYLTDDYSGQIQSTVSSVDHLRYDAVLKGVNTFDMLSFTSRWAEEHGGELLQTGCLLLHFQMPEDAGLLKSVNLIAPEPIFGESETLTLAMDNADMVSDNIVRAHLVTPMQGYEIPADMELILTVVSNIGTWSRNFTPGASEIQPGRRNIIRINSKNWELPLGDGSEANPYILRTAEDLRLMSSKLGNEKKYVAMVNDIDASSITTWASIGNTKALDFNGNNRTISGFRPENFNSDYAGFIGILNGRIADLDIVGAEINGKDGKACGILCGYVGQANANSFGEIENVHVEGTVSGKAAGVGGLAGIIGNGTISRCSADVEVYNNKDNTVSTYRTGGLVGYYNDGNTVNVCEITDCMTSGSVVGGMQKTGGIIGEAYGNTNYTGTNTMTIRNCYSTASVTGMRAVSGILAYATSNEPTAVVNCIAWNDKIEATDTNHGHSSSGAVVGRTYTLHSYTDCYRKPGINYICIFQDLDGVEASVCDQDNVDRNNKLVVGTYGETGSIYKTYSCSAWYPYHGKAAGNGSTVSSLAKELGWDQAVWDMSGSFPVLIR